MSSESWFSPVPESMHSVEYERPFTECLVCSAALGDCEGYTIMKSYRRDECVCEMAVCSDCSEQQSQRWSESSRQVAADFQRQRTDHLDSGEGDGENEGECCDYCGRRSDKDSGVAIYARCRGNLLWMTSHMCYECEDALHEQLSPETREENDRFKATHFPGPPEMEMDLPRPQVVPANTVHG